MFIPEIIYYPSTFRKIFKTFQKSLDRHMFYLVKKCSRRRAKAGEINGKAGRECEKRAENVRVHKTLTFSARFSIHLSHK